MKLETAALILSKIGNPTRLKIIQKKLGIPGSTLTHHISHLKTAKVIRQERHQATLYCIMEYEQLNKLVTYLTEECCIDDETQETAA